ncbi:GAF domain-containing sensor histidine kinase [Nocardioides pelophilus]|uniref:GAF domain-containing sensor histidine kinase n=1 Tax=Nocardioides pelophilus TaxID=2172019 RepID=UPI001602685E|nr:GAF domain-containing sensor histidine kinase [Nocardioides pelophilus]
MTDLTRIHELLVVAGELDLRSVARAFAEIFESDGATAFVIVDSDLTVGGAYPGDDAAAGTLRIPVGYGVVGLVAQNGNSVTIVDDSPRNPQHRALLHLAEGQVVSRLCVPAHGLEGAIVGVISVHRFDHRAFGEDELARAQRLADLVGLRLYAEGLRGAAEEHHSLRDQLIAQAISAQEAERRRIAGDLHDGVTQALASLSFHLSAAHTGLSVAARNGAADDHPLIAGTLDEIAEAKRLAGLAYDETRAAITGLHSLLLEDLGLVAALESLCQSLPQLDVEFRSDHPDEFTVVPDHAAAALFRIAQEALNNAIKHAQAQRVVLSLRRVGDAAVLGVTDDGAGFDVRSVRGRPPAEAGEHFGLASIVERSALIGATLRIDSIEGRGTAVIVELPLH